MKAALAKGLDILKSHSGQCKKCVVGLRIFWVLQSSSVDHDFYCLAEAEPDQSLTFLAASPLERLAAAPGEMESLESGRRNHSCTHGRRYLGDSPQFQWRSICCNGSTSTP
ncbi:hypothetical protein COP2_026011 [Malus domestica]